MRIIYNGVDLMPLETHAFDVQAVYDDSGTDYLYSKVSIVVRAIVNGGEAVVTGVSPNGPPISYAWDDQSVLRAGGVPDRGYPMWPLVPMDLSTGQVPAPGTLPTGPDAPVVQNTGSGLAARNPSELRTIIRRPNAPLLTHQAIRHRLQSPRGKLWVFAGAGSESGTIDLPAATAVVSLECPDEGMRCDCKNGPSPTLLSVHMATGDANTLMVDWSCEAYINEGPINLVNPTGALLSNRFAQTQMVDQSGHTTVITAGVAIFRADLVYALPQSPDILRSLLFMPICPGFIRENIQVTGREDVTGIAYSYRDRQVPVNFPAGVQTRAASISCVHRQAITSGGDVLEGALSAYERILGMRANKHIGDASVPFKPAKVPHAAEAPSTHPGGGI